MRKFLLSVLGTISLLAFAACGGNGGSENNNEEGGELLIGAAASLTNVMQELGDIFVEDNPHIAIEFTFASSGALQTQIEEGAPMDIFFSAAMGQMNALAEQGLIYGSSRNLLRNSIALIVPAGSPLNLGGFDDILNHNIELLGLGDYTSVPGGRFAQEAFETLGIWGEVYDKAVFAPDIRTVLTWVETGQVDAGVVFMTDAATTNQVQVVEVANPSWHSPSINPIGIVRDSQNTTLAQDFVEFLFSSEAEVVFERHGFSMY